VVSDWRLLLEHLLGKAVPKWTQVPNVGNNLVATKHLPAATPRLRILQGNVQRNTGKRQGSRATKLSPNLRLSCVVHRVEGLQSLLRLYRLRISGKDIIESSSLNRRACWIHKSATRDAVILVLQAAREKRTAEPPLTQKMNYATDYKKPTLSTPRIAMVYLFSVSVGFISV
jgi:hypothetical protein